MLADDAHGVALGGNVQGAAEESGFAVCAGPAEVVGACVAADEGVVCVAGAEGAGVVVVCCGWGGGRGRGRSGTGGSGIAGVRIGGRER